MKVAPLVGAWIETTENENRTNRKRVAPLVGAWIETDSTRTECSTKKSHPSWVRGLKQSTCRNEVVELCRTPRGCVD